MPEIFSKNKKITLIEYGAHAQNEYSAKELLLNVISKLRRAA